MGVHVALLRGINVGGHNKLPMKDLASMFREAGCGEVRTYIQSGNVVFAADDALAARIPGIITGSIREHFGFEVPLIMRSAGQLSDIVRANPFATEAADERELSVAFLADAPEESALEALDPQRSPPDELVVDGSQIYLRFPDGVARSKLTNAYFDATLRTTSTVRNWRTTNKLLELAESLSADAIRKSLDGLLNEAS